MQQNVYLIAFLAKIEYFHATNSSTNNLVCAKGLGESYISVEQRIDLHSQ